MATLKKAISVRLEPAQRLKLNYLGERNFKQKPVSLIRAGVDLMIALAERNNGHIPCADDVLLQRAITRRAHNDRRRTA
jgi:hypothetical protein